MREEKYFARAIQPLASTAWTGCRSFYMTKSSPPVNPQAILPTSLLPIILFAGAQCLVTTLTIGISSPVLLQSISAHKSLPYLLADVRETVELLTAL